MKKISSWYKEKDSFCGLLENSSAGLNYQIFLGCGTSNSTNSLGLIIIGAKVATAKFNIEITNDQKKSLQIADKKERHAQLDDQIAIFEVKLPNFEGKLETLIGNISVSFEPNEESILRQILNYKIVKKLFKDSSESNDFKIICQDESEDETKGDDTKEEDVTKDEKNVVEFNRNFLSKISDVFRRMIENPASTESRDGVIKMVDTNKETLLAFKHAFNCESPIFDKEQISVDLLMFSHKYDIPGLVDLCADYIGNNLEKDTILDIIKAAYFIEDSKLFKKAVAYLMSNLGKFEETSEWNDFKKSHPQCFVKIIEIMLFEHKFSEALKFQ